MHLQGDITNIFTSFRNLGFASFATLSHYTLPAIFQNPEAEKVAVPALRAVFEETLAVGRAMGFDEDALPSSVVEDTINRTAAIHRRPDSKHTPSMLLDLQNGRPMEIEVIVGEVVRKAKEHNVNIPVCLPSITFHNGLILTEIIHVED